AAAAGQFVGPAGWSCLLSHRAGQAPPAPRGAPPPPAGPRSRTRRDETPPNPACFSEAPQAKYLDTEERREASPELARALGLDGDAVSFPEPQFERPKRERRWVERGDISSMGVAATAQAL